MNQASFVDLLDFEQDYEIKNQYPFDIRCKRNGWIVSESDNGNGYVQLKLNKRKFFKHRIVAKQFLPNPDNLPEVDHKNGLRNDNRLENLRWISRSDNNKNKLSYRGIDFEYVNEIDSDTIVVEQYGRYELENYYFHDNFFYFFNGIKYRKLRILEDKAGNEHVNAITKDNKTIRIYYSKFKRETVMI